MKTLEEMIRDAAAEDRLNGMSLRLDPGGRGWQASAPSRSGGGAWTVSIGPDPVLALVRAFGVTPAVVVDLEDMLG